MKHQPKKNKQPPSDSKSKLHPRNRHAQRYDLAELSKAFPALQDFIRPNKYGDDSVDFADPAAVKALNTALLFRHYDLTYWDIPAGYLCPPIPGRADYLHYAADILSESVFGKVPKGAAVRCLDIGTGANLIYPIIGVKEYGWSFIGSETDKKALDSAQKIIENNQVLQGKIELRHQTNQRDIFHGILRKEETVHLTICNPPFHDSAEEAQAATRRKVRNLHGKKDKNPTQNFGGQSNELYTEGGEKRFLKDLVRGSKKFAENCVWFTSLVSKENTVIRVKNALKAAQTTQIRVIPMGQGNKKSRIVAWSYMTAAQRREAILPITAKSPSPPKSTRFPK